MKILYVITKSNWGGAQRNLYDLATAMKENGHSVSVALGGEGILRKRLEDAGIKTHPVYALRRNVNVSDDAASFWTIRSIIRREKPEVMHVHSPKAAGLGALAGRIAGVPHIIYTVHGWTFNEDRPWWQKLGIVFFSWLTVMLSHRTILLSEREYAQALKLPWSARRLALIPLGLQSPVFMSIDGARQIIGKNIDMGLSELGKKVIVGTIAELHPNKGLFYLINAIEEASKEHANVLCIIIGDGQSRDELKSLIQIKKLENHVRLAGYLDEAAHYLKAFNIFIFSSVKEGLPYALMEAGYASLPVIATTVGGIPEIVEDMKSGVLVQAKNSRELSHAVSFMIEHPAMRRQYGAALRESVMQKFSFEKMIAETEKLYRITAGR